MNQTRKQRLIPYRLLTYVLYVSETSVTWLESLPNNRVRLTTGEASRAFRIKISALWEALYWLSDQDLISGLEKEQKRGTVIITLIPPTNINQETSSE